MTADKELDSLRKKRYLEMKKKIDQKNEEENKSKAEVKKINYQELLSSLFVGRAWEVFSAARVQHPDAALYVGNALIKMANEDKTGRKVTGEDLYSLFRHLGIRIRLKTSVRYLKDGKLKSLGDTLREKSSE